MNINLRRPISNRQIIIDTEFLEDYEDLKSALKLLLKCSNRNDCQSMDAISKCEKLLEKLESNSK